MAEFLPSESDGKSHVATFSCQCSNQYRGSISQILSDSLSTLPFLHLTNSNLTILVEMEKCSKLKLSLDITELLFQRTVSLSNVNFILKVRVLFISSMIKCLIFSSSHLQISKSSKVSIPKVRLSSNQSCVVALSDIDGRASISGKVECIGCNHGDKQSTTATRPVDTLFALFVNSVSHFVIEHCQVEVPLRHEPTKILFETHS